MRRWRTGLPVLLLLLLGPVGGCGDGGFAPLIIPLAATLLIQHETVDNDPDHFEIKGTGVFLNSEREYQWTCIAPQATLDIQADTYLNTFASSFRLQVLDHSGALVHDNTYTAALLNARVRAVTRPGGVPGIWTLRFTFSTFHLAGTVDLRARPAAASDPDTISLGPGYAQDSGSLTYAVGWPSGEKTLQIDAAINAPSLSGSLRIQIWDPADVVVFDQTYTGPVTWGTPYPKTLSGAAGTWTLTISFDHVRNGPFLTLPD
jgi:hypothetical protein